MTHTARETPPGRPSGPDGQDESFWRSHTQISLQPVAAPSILGLYGFAAATFMVGANLAGWAGANSVVAPLFLFPFAAIIGGLAQFLAGMWSYRARDGVATAMHGTWGSFWIAYGIFFLLASVQVLPVGVVRLLPSPALTLTAPARVSLGYWFVVLAAITWMGAVAAIARNLALMLVLVTLASASTILAIGWLANYPVTVIQAGGDVLVASAVIAFYTASALMLEGAFQRSVLPVGTLWQRARRRRIPFHPIQYELGEPGVKAGQ